MDADTFLSRTDAKPIEEVIAMLQELAAEHPEARVFFGYNYGDHWRTQVAGAVANVEVGQVVYSDYHSMAKVITEDHSDYDSNKAVTAIILS